MNIGLHGTPAYIQPVNRPAPAFQFQGQQSVLTGRADIQPLPPGTAADIEARVTAAFATAPPKTVIGGALPFLRQSPDCLWQSQPERGEALGLYQPLAAPAACDFHITAEPSAAAYAKGVAHALAVMAAERGQIGALQKVVLARSLKLQGNAPVDIDRLLARLGKDPKVTAFRVRLPDVQGQRRELVGASPELLLEKSGAAILSHPLAGSARRLMDPAEDRLAAQALERSGKDHREHALVVEYILDTLAPFCRSLTCPEGTTITSTKSMWHLGTRIEGQLFDKSQSSALLAAKLHPTPAICGLPLDKAAALIQQTEPFARDFYAGAVGWCDALGDGAWYVAIRCAELCGNHARLYAGAGIVPGSDPAAEAAETGAKFGALLTALGLPPDAALPDASAFPDDQTR